MMKLFAPLLMGVLAWGLPGLAMADDAAPASAPSWGMPQTAKQDDRVGLLDLRIKNQRVAVVLGAPESRMAMIGSEFWDLAALKQTGVAIAEDVDASNLCVLSTDGKLLAVAERNPRESGADVTLWNTATGEQVSHVPQGERNSAVESLLLAGSKRLVIGENDNSLGESRVLEVWDAQTGKLQRRMKCMYYRKECMALTADGRYIALSDGGTTKVYDVEEGRCVGTMGSPFINGAPVPYINNRAMFLTDDMITFLAFNPQGTELAGLVGYSRPELVLWNPHGELIGRYSLNAFGLINPQKEQVPLVWSATGKLLLIDGYYLWDRGTMRPIVKSEPPVGMVARSTFLDDSRVLHVYAARGRYNALPSEVAAIPSENIRAYQAAMADLTQPAALRASQKVSVKITLQNVVGDQADAEKRLRAVLMRCLVNDGITVEEGQRTIVEVKLEQASGEMKNPLKSAPPRPTFPGQPAFPVLADLPAMVMETRAMVTLRITAGGATQPAFTECTAFAMGYDAKGKNRAPQSCVQAACDWLRFMPFPVYLSQDGKEILPIGLKSTYPPENFFTFHP